MKYFRVCKAHDWSLQPQQYKNTNYFVSSCATLASAQELLRRPPRPDADLIVSMTVTGKVLPMFYADGAPGTRKKHEDEVLIPLAAVTASNIFQRAPKSTNCMF